jgi:hypothetical protein
VRLVIVYNGTAGLSLLFNQEQNGLSTKIGEVKGLEWASIRTLDLFLHADPATGSIRM